MLRAHDHNLFDRCFLHWMVLVFGGLLLLSNVTHCPIHTHIKHNNAFEAIKLSGDKSYGYNKCLWNPDQQKLPLQQQQTRKNDRDILAKGKFFQEMQHLETITQKKDVLKKIMHTHIYIYT